MPQVKFQAVYYVHIPMYLN